MPHKPHQRVYGEASTHARVEVQLFAASFRTATTHVGVIAHISRGGGRGRGGGGGGGVLAAEIAVVRVGVLVELLEERVGRLWQRPIQEGNRLCARLA